MFGLAATGELETFAGCFVGSLFHIGSDLIKWGLSLLATSSPKAAPHPDRRLMLRLE